MTEWWKVSFMRRKTERDFLMRFLRITVYGSFYPPYEKKNLEDLCAFLRKEGFEDSDVVEGKTRPNPGGLGPMDVSVFYLEESDANFLVYTLGGKRLGVTSECDYVLFSPSMCGRLSTCVVFDQTTADGKDSIGPLQIDKLLQLNSLRCRIPVVPFETFDELKKSAFLYATDYFKANGTALRGRV